MWTVARWTSFALFFGAIAVQFIRPARTNPVTDPARTLSAVAVVPPEAVHVLERACRDCHSNDTRWPWYSNVAPVSWFVIDHVNHGRRHFNYSDWAQYEARERDRLLEKSCALARDGEMPMPSYTWMHRDARLNAADVRVLCRWVEQQSTRMPDCQSAHATPGC